MIGYYDYTVILTYLGLTSGMLGIFNAASGKTTIAIICLMLSGFCDMFDGTVARTKERTKSEKRFGIQLDSLSDLVCFGVLPVLIIYSSISFHGPISLLIYVFYVLAALTRLAYFNVKEEERQDQEGKAREEYEGLPVTSIALILPIICLLKKYVCRFFPFIGLISLLIVGIAFITKFKLKKVKNIGMIVMIIVGLIEVSLLILSKLGLIL